MTFNKYTIEEFATGIIVSEQLVITFEDDEQKKHFENWLNQYGWKLFSKWLAEENLDYMLTDR